MVPIWVIKEMDKIWLIKVLLELIKEELISEINLTKEELIKEINLIKEEPTLVSSIPLIQLTETELMDKVFRMQMDNSEDSEMDLVKSSDSDKDSQTLVLGSSNQDHQIRKIFDN